MACERRQDAAGEKRCPQFAIIGFVIWIVLQFIFGMIVFGTISAAMYG